MAAHKYIMQTDRCWRVKIKRGEFRTSKQFDYLKYAGIDRALKAAIIWRDWIIESQGLLLMDDYIDIDRSPNLVSKTITQPIIGVSLNRLSWRARFHRDKRQIIAHFFIATHGNVGAFQMACKARYENSGTLVVLNKQLMPARPKSPFILQ